MKYEDIKIADFRMVNHMAFDSYHISKSKGQFDCEGLSIHGKEVIRMSRTEKSKKTGKFLKAKNKWALNEVWNSPLFKKLSELVDYYCGGELDKNGDGGDTGADRISEL